MTNDTNNLSLASAFIENNSTGSRKFDSNPCYRAALEYLGRGWSVLAIRPPRIGDDTTGKIPNGVDGSGRWKDFSQRLPTVDELRQSWENCPQASVGIAMGHVSGIVGIDIDGPRGDLALEVISNDGELPKTLAFHTGAEESTRILYSIPKRHPCPILSFDHTDGTQPLKILGDGSQTVAPPSLHWTGGRYSWMIGRSPRECQIAPAPAWLLELLRDHSPGGASSRSPAAPTTARLSSGKMLQQGGRNNYLFRIASGMCRFDCGENEIYAALTIFNSTRCDPPLPDSEVWSISRGTAARYQATVTPSSAAPGTGSVLNPTSKPALNILDSDQFFAVVHKREWLIESIFMKGFPILGSGAEKTYKTLLFLCASICIATGTKFLGKYAVPRRAKSLFFSAELGGPALQQTAIEMLKTMGLTKSDLSGQLFWSESAPALGLEGVRLEIIDAIVNRGVEFVVFDPGYMMLRGEQKVDIASIFEMGNLLSGVNEIAKKSGATVAVVHHNSRGQTRANRFKPAVLGDVSGAGFPEWAHQWFLLSERSEYVPGEIRELWVNQSGRDGFGSVFSLDVDVGVLDANFQGRKWQTSFPGVMPFGSGKKRSVGTSKKSNLEIDSENILKQLRIVPEMSCSKLEDALALSYRRVDAALKYLLAENRIISKLRKVPTGKQPEDETKTVRKRGSKKVFYYGLARESE